jgi:anti-sigma factor RsiW
MECNEVRDHFSALLEGELGAAEEEKVRKHLGSCGNCLKEWKEFNRMPSWLNTIEAEDVPERFLSEIQKKREERKGQERRGGGWSLRSMKIPIQAAAMVMIVFFALYLNKMAPFDMFQNRAVEKPEVAESGQEWKEPALKEGEEQKKTSPPIAPYRKEHVSEVKATVTDGTISAKDRMGQEIVSPKETAETASPRVEEKRREQEKVGDIRMSLTQKSVRKITLKISDRQRAFFQIQELVKKLGGEVLKEGEDILQTSLPASIYTEFENELAQIGSPPAPPKSIVPKERKDDLVLAARAKSKDPEEKGKEPKRSTAFREDTVFIRIRLILE